MIAHSRSRAGLTLIQLVELIAITGLAAAFLFPVITTRGEFCNGRCYCMGNLKQLALATMMYAQDYDECYSSCRPDPRADWGTGSWGSDQTAVRFRSSSFWIAQLFPYVKNPGVFRCPQDADPERNQTSAAAAGSATPFPVSYGPNRLFVNPWAYGRKRPVSQASVVRPDERYLLADCVSASGFDMDTISYVRYANYDPSLRQNGRSLDQLTAMGRVAWPDEKIASITRHMLGSNMMFADGHVKWLRHDQIPNNDGPSGQQYRKLKEKIVPWQPVADDP